MFYFLSRTKGRCKAKTTTAALRRQTIRHMFARGRSTETRRSRSQ